MVGEKFGRLLVLERVGTNKRGEKLWKCQCVCGKEIEVKTHNLRAGRTQSCGCLGTGPKRKDDVVGKRYKSLTIIKYVCSDKHRESMYEYRCECGATGEIRRQHIGKTKDCPACRLHRQGPIRSSYWSSIVKNAQSRNLPFEITKENAWEKYVDQKGKCALTGVEISIAQNEKEIRTGVQTASLDRIKSNQGYVAGNVQWVHKKINTLKWDFDEDELYKWCKLVVEKRENV